MNDENIEQYNKLKLELEQIENHKTEGLIIRSKVRWYEQGGKSNKYFLNLEKRNQTKKCISKLYNKECILLTKQSDIRDEVKDFYVNLYKSNICHSTEKKVCENMFLNQKNLPNLSEDLKSLCEGYVTKDECKQAIKKFKNGKSPGNDGLGIEFYKFFWNDISDLLINCYNEAFDKGSLSASQTQAIITLLDKNKYRLYIKKTGGQFRFLMLTLKSYLNV
jgi:hypothetical protein